MRFWSEYIQYQVVGHKLKQTNRTLNVSHLLVDVFGSDAGFYVDLAQLLLRNTSIEMNGKNLATAPDLVLICQTSSASLSLKSF